MWKLKYHAWTSVFSNMWKRKGRRGDWQQLLFLTKLNPRWPNCHRYMNKGDSYADQRNHRTNSFWWFGVMTPLDREAGLVYWLVDTATVSDTNMASPWRQPSGLCQQQIGHHNHHPLSASFFLKILGRKWERQREREKTAVSIIIPSHMVGVYCSGEKIKYARCELFDLLTTEAEHD